MWMSWFAVGVTAVETVATEAPRHHQRMKISSQRLRPVVNVGIVDRTMGFCFNYCVHVSIDVRLESIDSSLESTSGDVPGPIPT